MVVLVLRFKKRGADAGAFLGDLLGLRAEVDFAGALGPSFGICDGVAGSIVGGIGWGLCRDMFPIAVLRENSLLWAAFGVLGVCDSATERSPMVVDKEKDRDDPDAKVELAHSEVE